MALVCKELSKVPEWKVLKVTAFPPGLDAFYTRIMDQIIVLEDAEDRELCTQILAVVSAVYRPVTFEELSSLVDMPAGITGDYEALSEIIGLCGSFLTLQEHTISFVHQSAKDFLIKKAHNEIYPLGAVAVHHTSTPSASSSSPASFSKPPFPFSFPFPFSSPFTRSSNSLIST